MIQGEALIIVVNEGNADRLNGALFRACAHCSRTAQALVLDLCANVNPDLAALKAAVMRGYALGLPAVSIVAAPDWLDDLRAISLEAANCGWVLGAFTDRDAAIAHALRERGLVTAEAALLADSSASIVVSVKFNNA